MLRKYSARWCTRVRAGVGVGLCATLSIAACAWACSPTSAPELTFDISFPESASASPLTGRVFAIISETDDIEPRLQIGWGFPTTFLGLDVEELRPGQPARIDRTTLGYPARSLEQLPAGDYFVQGLFNIYTGFHRSDGHVVWAPMDQWEGQQFNRSAGNLISGVRKMRLDPKTGYRVNLSLTEEIPPVVVPPDSKWVKRIKFESKLLSRFWGHPIYLGATVLLPRGYDDDPERYFPVVYQQGHFNLKAPFGFTTDDSPLTEQARLRLRGQQPGYEFYQAWSSDGFPRMIAVTFQHPTPYFDDSYAVNSANNGPYGDAIMTELIPRVEETFRIIKEPYARVLTGRSTGGWESLALQIYHPEFFGGTWTFAPDPVDFRRYGLSDIYFDKNAFFVTDNEARRRDPLWLVRPGQRWLPQERPFGRAPDGQTMMTMRDFSYLDAVRGSKSRSGQQLSAWEAAYGPVGDDGYPRPLWDRLTGAIDREVAHYMRDNGYDLRHYLERNWPRIGPALVGKLRIYCGDMDNHYLNQGLYLLEDFLNGTQNPHYPAYFEYGRPEADHFWQPMTNSELLEMMAEHIRRNASHRTTLESGASGVPRALSEE